MSQPCCDKAKIREDIWKAGVEFMVDHAPSQKEKARKEREKISKKATGCTLM